MRTGLSYDEALAASLAAGRRLDSERVPLADACGRIAAAAVQAPFALPGFDNAAMDGYAVRAADLAQAAGEGLPVTGTILAGDTHEYLLAPHTAMGIMTGAPLPRGADTVVVQEQARREGDRVWLPAAVRPGANVRPADDDWAAGATILAVGELLTPARVAVLSGFGLSGVEVVRRPCVAILTTGDELVPPGRPRGHGQRHDSNGPLLAGCTMAAGARVLAVRHCGDDPDALVRQMQALSADADLLLTCGGVSMGAADFLPNALGRIGEVYYWKVRMKPGMPVLFGRIGHTYVFALPGNPVSAGVTFQVLALPLLWRLLGRAPAPSLRVRPATPWRKTHARLEFLRVTLAQDAEGCWRATPVPHQGSGALGMLAAAHALVRLDEGEREYGPDDVLEAQWLPGAGA